MNAAAAATAEMQAANFGGSGSCVDSASVPVASCREELEDSGDGGRGRGFGGGGRVVFVVNVWLGGSPWGVSAFPSSELHRVGHTIETSSAAAIKPTTTTTTTDTTKTNTSSSGVSSDDGGQSKARPHQIRPTPEGGLGVDLSAESSHLASHASTPDVGLVVVVEAEEGGGGEVVRMRVPTAALLVDDDDAGVAEIVFLPGAEPEIDGRRVG